MASMARAARAASRTLRAASLLAAPLAVPASAARALSAVAVRAEPSFLSKLFGGGANPISPPMTDPMPGVVLPEPAVHAPSPPATKITTLANGLRIVTELTPGPTTTVALYVDAGSKHETPMTSGVTHLLERMAYKATTNRTHFRFVREAEAIGANLTAAASREHIAYTADGLKSHLPELVELVADTAVNPVFNAWDVDAQLAKMTAEVADKSPSCVLNEGLHTAAYTGGLGHALLATPRALKSLGPAELAEHVNAHFGASRMVLAVAGAAHEDVLAIAEPLFGPLPRGSPAPGSSTSKYVGGDWRSVSDVPEAHVTLGFEFKGGWRNIKAATTVSVLQMLLGGGNSFSAGGPGKGMYSRLYTRVLNHHGWVKACSAYATLYNDTGVVGISGTTHLPEKAEDLVAVMVAELRAVADAANITPAELDRAKKASVSSLLMNLESRSIVAEDLGCQVLTYGERKPPAEYIADVQAVTAADLAAVVKELLRSPLSMASWGAVTHVPRYEDVQKKFK